MLGINHGGLGVVAWNDPTTPSIKSSASSLALSLSSSMKAFILSPSATFRHFTTSSRVDVGLWTVGGKTLLLATNLNYDVERLGLEGVPEAKGKRVRREGKEGEGRERGGGVGKLETHDHALSRTHTPHTHLRSNSPKL